MLKLEDLEVYQLSMEYADDIWNLVTGWEIFSKIHLGGQMVEAADSIGFNISEGYGRFHYKENKQFCYYARGSLFESKTGLAKAIRRRLISEAKYRELFEKLETIHFKLNAYIKSIGRTK